MRLAIVASHPVQYCAPLFRALAGHLDLTVFYAHRASPSDQARAGFGIGFDWDLDLLSGYAHEFLENVAPRPGLDRFLGVDTPQIAMRLRAGSFDAVLLMGWHLKCFHQALWAAKRLHLPVLVRGDSHLDTPRAAWKRWAKAIAYPIFLRRFDAALVVGTRNRAYWRHYGYPKARMFDAPHCVDNDWFAARATPAARSELRARLDVAPSAKLALFAGKLVSFKRPLDLVEATAQVRAAGEGVEIVVAGAGPLEPDLRARAASLKIPLHVLGFCNQTEMPAAYAAADLLVLPSDGRETWGLVVNEALACGCPILISDAVGCAPDRAAQLGDGAVFPMGDVRALAARLRDQLAKPPDACRIRAVSMRFSIGAASARAVEALASVTGVNGVDADGAFAKGAR
jgi:glycosyltransferase involved in cell wall biosynthesis